MQLLVASKAFTPFLYLFFSITRTIIQSGYWGRGWEGSNLLEKGDVALAGVLGAICLASKAAHSLLQPLIHLMWPATIKLFVLLLNNPKVCVNAWPTKATKESCLPLHDRGSYRSMKESHRILSHFILFFILLLKQYEPLFSACVDLLGFIILLSLTVVILSLKLCSFFAFY